MTLESHRDRNVGVGGRLLYVSRDDDRRDDLRTALETETDMTVTATTDGDDGFDTIAEFDCIVSTHNERNDGIEFLETVRADHPDLPFVLVTTDGDERLASRAITAGVTEYVPIDDGPEAVLERVRAAIETTPRTPRDDSMRMPIEDRGIHEELRLKERAMDAAPVGITISGPSEPDNPLIYVNDAFERLTGYAKEETVGRNCRFLQGEESDPEAIASMAKAIDEERPVSVELINYRKDDERFWNQVDIAPIRDENGEVTNYVGFQTDITARKEAEFEVKRERRNLEHLLNRINGLIQDVTRELVQAGSREDIERAVCERLADTNAYTFAWIGEPDLGRNRVVPNAWAGEWDPTAEDLKVGLTDADVERSPTARASETRAVQIVEDPDAIAEIAGGQPWFDVDMIDGVAAVPLVYRDTLYGVLTVFTTEPGVLNDRETVVLEALARAAATAINALERGRIISADNVVELEFEIHDPGLFFVDISARVDCQLEYSGSVYQSDASTLMFFTTDGDSGEIMDVAKESPDIEAATLISDGDGTNLFEFRVADTSIVTTLAERGAKTRSITAAEGSSRVRVELPNEADARAIVELLKNRYPETELVAYRERERPPKTKQEFIADLEDRLTERQLTALQKAYLSGFYEWNRPVSGQDLAESMGVARSTYHQHLRAAERKLVEEFFER